MRCQNARFHMGMGGPSDCPEGGWVEYGDIYVCKGLHLVMLVTLICKFKISPVPFRSAHEDADL